MSTYGGLAFYFEEPEHRASLLRRIQNGDYFTETVSNRDLRPSLAEICLLSFDGKTVSHICLARSSKMAVTAQMALKFSHFTDVGALRLGDFDQIPELRHLVTSLFIRRVTRLDPPTWAALVTALKSLRPELAPAIDELETKRQLVGRETESPAAATIAQERDATRLVLEIFGLDKEDIRDSLEFDIPPEPAPFLKGLKAVKLREDPMIDHDAGVLPDFSDMRRFIQGSVEFSKGNERITVLNVNRSDVEKVLGVDLIYYTHTFESYVMVQYKRMHQIGRDWEFNLNEWQFLDDLRRMDEFNCRYPSTPGPSGPRAYRLNEHPFYFKFCKEITLEPMNSEMIDGMYLPREYLGTLMESPFVGGQRGGKVLRYKNSFRHFNNTQFIGLVRGGWVGSRTQTTDVITELVRKSIEANHSVLVGVAGRT